MLDPDPDEMNADPQPCWGSQSFSPSCAITVRRRLFVRDFIFIFVKYLRQVEVFLRSFV
jgi:hypothetical protein